MQYVLDLSALTYECTQVTPRSALRSTTPRQAAALAEAALADTLHAVLAAPPAGAAREQA